MTCVDLFTTDSIPQVGGIARYLHEMMIATRSCASWHLHTTVPAGAFDDGSLPYPVRRIDASRHLGSRPGDHLAPIRKLNTLRWKIGQRSSGRRHVLEASARSPDGIVAIGRWCPDSRHWIDACRRTHVPYLVFTYGMELLASEVEDGRLDAADLRLAERVITISDATARQLLVLGVSRTRILMMRPGCREANPASGPATDRSRTLEALGLGSKRFILAMGRIVRRKGFDLAARAWAQLAREYPDHVLAIAGDGPDLAAVESAVRSSGVPHRFRLLGPVSEEQKAALMTACSFFVMPNRPVPGDMEGFGIVFLEAALAGKPSIGGNNGGVPDVIVDGVTGALVETDDGEAHLVATMRSWLTDPGRVEALGERARARALTEFDWTETSREFRDWLSSRQGSTSIQKSSPRS